MLRPVRRRPHCRQNAQLRTRDVFVLVCAKILCRAQSASGGRPYEREKRGDHYTPRGSCCVMQ